MSATARLVVFSNPHEGQEEEFNDWYTHTHAPDILKLGVAVGFTRFRCSGVPLMPGVPEPARYAVIYEITARTTDEVREAVRILEEAVAAGRTDVSDSMDLSSLRAAWLLPITEHITTDSATNAAAAAS